MSETVVQAGTQPATGGSPALLPTPEPQPASPESIPLHVDAEDVDERGEVRVKGAKFKKMNQVYRAVRDLGVDPEHAAGLIQLGIQAFQAHQAAQQAPSPEPADDDGKRRVAARKALHELDPAIPAVHQAVQELAKMEVARVQAIAADAREVMTTELSTAKVDLGAAEKSAVEEMVSASIAESPEDWRRFQHGIAVERIVRKHLKTVLTTLGKVGGADRPAAVEAVKRRSAALPPRLPGAGTPSPTPGVAQPPRTMREAEDRLRQRLSGVL